MADDVLRAQVEIDITPLRNLTGEIETTSGAILRQVEAFQAQGLSAAEARSALINLGTSASTVDKALGRITESSAASTVALSAFERATQTAGARMLAMELGAGRMGMSMARLGVASGVLGPIIQAAFPVIAIVGMIDLLDVVAEKLEKVRDKVLDADIAWQNVDHSAISFNDHLAKQLEESAVKLEHFTKIGMGELDDSIRKATIDTDSLFSHVGSMLTEFASMEKTEGKGLFMQFLSGQGGPEEVVSAAKKAQDEIKKALNAGDVAGATAATSRALDAIIEREEELKQIVGAGDRLKAYQQLYEILSRVNVALAQSVDLAKATDQANAAERNAGEMRKLHEEGMRDSKEAAEEELADLARVAQFEKSTHEEGMKYSKEAASEELETIHRRDEAEKQSSEITERERSTSLEREETAARASIAAMRERSKEQLATQERTGAGGGVQKNTAAAEFANEEVVLRTLIAAEGNYRQAVAATNIEETKKAALMEASERRQVGLEDQITAALSRTQAELQKISLQNPWLKLLESAERYQHVLQTIQTTAASSLSQTTQAFNSNFVQWMNGGETFGRAMQKVWVGFADQAVESILKAAEQWLIGMAIHKAMAQGEAKINAGVAASGGIASMAAAPFPIDTTAPAFGEAMGAAAMAAGSFEEGGIVPSTQMALVHAGEGVLPRNLTSMLTSAADNGGGASSNFHFHATINAVDTRGMKELLDQHTRTFARSARDYMRRRR